MSMVTMNPAAAGGPVGGIMMINNGSPAIGPGINTSDSTRASLNTYIYDYLLKHGHYDVARSMAQDKSFEFQSGPKSSPGRRKDGDMNGDAGDGMDMDVKDNAPDDLPRPRGWEGSHGTGFLLEWFSIFSDLLQAHRNSATAKTNGGLNPAAQYLQHEKDNQRLRENQQNQNINRQGMNPAMVQQMRSAMNGTMPAKMAAQHIQAMNQKRVQMQAQAMQQMNRGGQADVEINGVRSGSPGDGDAGGSPSKRPRIDNGQQNFPQGMMPNGRPGGVPGAQNQMMIQAGFTPQLAQQFQRNGAINGAMPPKGMQPGMPNGMMTMANAGSPMMGGGMNQFPEGMQLDMYNRQNMQGGQPMQGGGGAQSGNHALQDYQMQLMLLEQQNKKRLMMARQEQHENNPAGGGIPGVNMQPGMSPSGNRSGTSPNPGEMKRTPGLSGLPGSPSAAEAMAGRSPAGMGFNNMMQGPDFNPGMFMAKDQPMMPGGPQGIRPPTSNDMNAMRQQASRANQFAGGQPMTQQGSQAGQQMGTPGQRTDMPPPQAPAGSTNPRNTGNSPAGPNAPPTPSQTSKPAPKKKTAAQKDDNKRQRPTKKGSTAAPSSDDNPPATPTPSTPITPNNPGILNVANKGQPGMQPGNQHQQNQGMQMSQQMQQNDLGIFNFGEPAGAANDNFNLDFSTLENAEVLENFDFDSFLNTSADDTFNFNADVDISTEFGMGQGE